MSHHTQTLAYFSLSLSLLLSLLLSLSLSFVEAESPSVTQAGLKLLGSSDPPALASQSAQITSVSHQGQSIFCYLFIFEIGCRSVAQAGVLWHEHGSLQSS